jgi:gliding motility-associated-like protein
MKNNLFFYAGRLSGMVLLFLLFTLGSKQMSAQIQSPCDANPFCSDSSYNFPNTISGHIPTTVDSGCLGSAPAPIWYWMQIGTAGTMQLTLSQQTTAGIGIDVDFAMYGPFTSLPLGCAAILAGAAPIQCSYSSSFTETLGLGLPGGSGVPGATTPPAAQVGEVYIVLMTNFYSSVVTNPADAIGTISFSQTGGTGSADCAIVCGLTATNNGPFCYGHNVTLTANNSDTTQTFTYYWSGPSGFAATGKNVIANPAQDGTFTYNLISVSQQGDTCTASTEVIIHPLPDVALTDQTDKVLCNVASTVFAMANPSAADSFQWYFNNVVIPGQTGFNITADSTGTYKVIGFTDFGCMDSSSIHLTLNQTDVSFDYLFTPACEQDTVRLTNTSEAGLYWWTFGDGATDTVTNPMHIYQDQSVYPITLVVQDLDGCIDSLTRFVDIQHPLVSSFTMSDDSLCQTDATPVQFTDVSIGNRVAWHWDFGDGATSTAQNPSHAYTLAGTHQVRLVINDTIVCYDTAFKNIYVDSLPFVHLVTDKHAICEGDEVNFALDYLHPALNVNWDFGDGVHWLQEEGTTHSYDNAGTYWVTATANYPVCDAAVIRDSVVVSGYPVVYLGPDSVMCLDGPSITLADQNNNGNPAVTWLWSTGATTSSITVVHPGIYAVTATEKDCSTTDQVVVNKDCYTDIPNAFTPNGDGENDYFYPRQLLAKGVTGFTMTVFNRWGQKVFETANPDGRGWDGKFNEKEQPMGVYIYQIHAVMKNGKIEDYNGNVTLVR